MVKLLCMQAILWLSAVVRFLWTGQQQLAGITEWQRCWSFSCCAPTRQRVKFWSRSRHWGCSDLPQVCSTWPLRVLSISFIIFCAIVCAEWSVVKDGWTVVKSDCCQERLSSRATGDGWWRQSSRWTVDVRLTDARVRRHDVRCCWRRRTDRVDTETIAVTAAAQSTT